MGHCPDARGRDASSSSPDVESRCTEDISGDADCSEVELPSGSEAGSPDGHDGEEPRRESDGCNPGVQEAAEDTEQAGAGSGGSGCVEGGVDGVNAYLDRKAYWGLGEVEYRRSGLGFSDGVSGLGWAHSYYWDTPRSEALLCIASAEA